ncbi:MAG: DHH family phosphoesterase, partial [Lentisphaeria bacterium]|nr:DHH family phosphoesterase [Lentisphaeria bacterium]
MNHRLGRLLRPSVGVYFVVMAVFCAVTLLAGEYWLAAGEAAITLAAFGVYVMNRKRRERQIQKYLRSAPNTLESLGQGESPFPAVVVRLADGGIVWTNRRFSNLTGISDTMMEYELEEILPGFSTDWLASGKTESPHDVTLDGRRYRVYGTCIRAEDNRSTMLGVMYLSDLTELYQVRDEYIRSRPVVSLIVIDNYEELIKNLSESGISTMNAKINDAINAWTESYSGLLRKMERNRFLFIFEKRDLSRAMEDKFSLLEDIHEITNPAGLPASISFGLGVDAVDFDEGYKFAALGIEMALSRGGDQAVIKDRFNFTFFGGRNKEADYRSKVRSRVTANSLMELIGQSGHVFIMGHKNADLDAVGAAMGICSLCRKKGKKASIILDLEVNASKKLIEEIRQVPEY